MISQQIHNPKKERVENERCYLKAQLDEPGLELRNKVEITVIH